MSKWLVRAGRNRASVPMGTTTSSLSLGVAARFDDHDLGID